MISVRSVTDEADARAVPPVADTKSYRLDALRTKLGAWMKQDDVFMTAAKAPVDPTDEASWTLADVCTEPGGLVLIRRARVPTARPITVRSMTDEADARALPPVADTRSYRLGELRRNLGSWMKWGDVFVTVAKATVDPSDEASFTLADVCAEPAGVILIRRAQTLTVRSLADASDQHVVASAADPKTLMLDVLRTTLGDWLKEKDRFLDKAKVAVPPGMEATRLASDVVVDNAVLVRREVQRLELEIRRGAAKTGPTIRVAASATLAQVRAQLEQDGEMTGMDAFLEADATRQVPLDDEAVRPVTSALKDKVLTFISRADW